MCFLLGLMDTNLFGISPTWSSLAAAISIPAPHPPFFPLLDRHLRANIKMADVRVSVGNPEIGASFLCCDCFLLQTSLFSIIDFPCLLSQSDVFDLVSPELSKGRLRLSGTVTDSVSPDACKCLFVLSWNEWDLCSWSPKSPPMQLFLHLVTPRTILLCLSRLRPSQW